MKSELQVQDITVFVERKAMKNIYIRIKPDGRVVLSCPRRTTDREVRYLIEERYHWIVTHRQQVLQRQSALSVSTAERVPLWGTWYPLRVEVEEGRPRAAIEGGAIVLRGSVNDEAARAQALNDLYRIQLNAAIPPLLAQAERASGLHPNEWHIRNMHTRWGSCNVQKRRIWLSLNLAKYPQACLYCVIIHELTHLLERGHNDHFYALMDRFEPNWRSADRLLKSGLPPST